MTSFYEILVDCSTSHFDSSLWLIVFVTLLFVPNQIRSNNNTFGCIIASAVQGAWLWSTSRDCNSIICHVRLWKQSSEKVVIIHEGTIVIIARTPKWNFVLSEQLHHISGEYPGNTAWNAHPMLQFCNQVLGKRRDSDCLDKRLLVQSLSTLSPIFSRCPPVESLDLWIR